MELGAQTRLAHIVVTELRIRMEGPQPYQYAKFKLLLDDGMSFGVGTFTAWSPESRQLLLQLRKSIEADLVATLDRGEVMGVGSWGTTDGM